MQRSSRGRPTRQNGTSGSVRASITALVVILLVVGLAMGLFYVLLGTAADEPGALTVTELEPGNATVDENETVSVSATIENTGQRTTEIVEISVGDQDLRQLVTLDTGERETLTLESISAESLGIGDTVYDVRTESDERTATLTVVSDRPAAFEVSWNGPESAAFEEGGTVDISATITNSGGDSDSQTVELRTGNRTLFADEIALGPGETTTFDLYNFHLARLSPGEHTIGVYTNDDSATLDISIPEPARFEVMELDPGPDSLALSDKFRLSAIVRNTGDVRANRTLEFSVNDDIVETKELDLAPGDGTIVEFGPVDADSLGVGTHTYTLSTGDESDGGSFGIEGDKPAVFRIQWYEPGDVVLGQDRRLNVSAEVMNTGEQTAEERFAVRINGNDWYTTTLTLSPYESTEIQVYNIDLSELDPGTHEYSLDTYGSRETATVHLDPLSDSDG